MNTEPNTPSREAMDAIKQISGVEEFYPHADYALIIDRHFAPIRAELARLRNVPVAYCTTCNMEVREPTPTDDACTTALVNAQPNPPDIGRAISERLMDLIDAPTGGAEGTPETDAIFDAYNSPPYTTGLIDVKRKMRELERALTQSREEVARYKTKADECWGAANYRLKYLVSLYVALGMKVNDENPESQRLEASEMITALRLRVAELEKAHDYVLKDNHILRQHLRSQEAVIAERDRLAATVATLQRDKADAEKDAARYQYLRNDPPSSLCVRKKSKSVIVSDLIYVDGENLDGLIDAALSTPKPEGIQPNIKT